MPAAADARPAPQPTFVVGGPAGVPTAAAPADSTYALAQGMYNAAEIDLAAERYADAMGALETVMELAVTDSTIPREFVHRARILAARVYLARSSYSLAHRELDAVLSEREEYVDALVIRGQVAEAQKRFDDAMVDYVAAVSIEPHNTDAVVGLERVMAQARHGGTTSMPSPPTLGSAESLDKLPPFWEEMRADDGRQYYVDHTTGEKHWRLPPEYEQRAACTQAPLPPFWEEKRDPNGQVFYVDHRNKITTWSRPS